MDRQTDTKYTPISDMIMSMIYLAGSRGITFDVISVAPITAIQLWQEWNGLMLCQNPEDGPRVVWTFVQGLKFNGYPVQVDATVTPGHVWLTNLADHPYNNN